MRTFTRLSLVAAAAVFAQMANAAFTYDVLQASITYQDGHSSDLNWDTGGGSNSITFTAPTTGDAAGPMGVGDGFWTGNGHAAADITIIYTVVSDVAINSIDLIFTGEVQNLGTVGYSELVESWSPGGGSGSILASTSGLVKGSGFSGGTDGEFTQETALNFGSTFTYKVKKTFTLADLDATPNLSLAKIGLIEQNAVPEPATMGALAMGALGLLARRRRK